MAREEDLKLLIEDIIDRAQHSPTRFSKPEESKIWRPERTEDGANDASDSESA